MDPIDLDGTHIVVPHDLEQVLAGRLKCRGFQDWQELLGRRNMEVVSIKHLNTKEQDGTYPLKTKFFETINIGSNVQANGNASLLRAV